MERRLEKELATGGSLMDVAMGATRWNARGCYGRNTHDTDKSLIDDNMVASGGIFTSPANINHDSTTTGHRNAANVARTGTART